MMQSAPVHKPGEFPSIAQTGLPVKKDRAGFWVLAATILGSSIAFIDGTVANVAIPVIQTDLNVSVSAVQWIVEAYTLFLAALILVGGSLGDHYGRKRFFEIGISIFTIAFFYAGWRQTSIF